MLDPEVYQLIKSALCGWDWTDENVTHQLKRGIGERNEYIKRLREWIDRDTKWYNQVCEDEKKFPDKDFTLSLTRLRKQVIDFQTAVDRHQRWIDIAKHEHNKRCKEGSQIM